MIMFFFMQAQKDKREQTACDCPACGVHRTTHTRIDFSLALELIVTPNYTKMSVLLSILIRAVQGYFTSGKINVYLKWVIYVEEM